MRTRAFILLTLLPLAGPRLSAFEILPLQPTECDELTLVITQGFSADCNWGVFPTVTSTEDEILVQLRVRGQLICRQVPVERTFRVPLGRFDPGTYRVRVEWTGDPPILPVVDTLTVAEGTCARPGDGFLRGDVDADGQVAINDAVRILSYLFQGGTIDCLDAADVDDQSAVIITDAVVILVYLFLGGVPPAKPFPECGPPLDGFRLGCEVPACGSDGEPIWMARGDGCFQCEPCETPSLGETVEALRGSGFEVLDAALVSVIVCNACHRCPTGRVYLVLVPPDDAAILAGRGWIEWDGPPPED